MNVPYDPLAIENLRMSPEEMTELKAAATASRKESPRQTKPLWCKFDYNRQIELARQSRNAIIAVQTELYRLRFKAYDKAKPIPVGNQFLKSLGISHHAKIWALKKLEKVGIIEVDWRKNRTPLVTIIGF